LIFSLIPGGGGGCKNGGGGGGGGGAKNLSTFAAFLPKFSQKWENWKYWFSI